MGASKAESFSEGQQALALIAKALGHPARVAIVEYLLKVEGCICNDIVGELPLSQATVSQHLRELKGAGLIKGSIEGNAICYCIDVKAINRLQSYLAGVSAKLKAKKGACC
ncbi:MAG: metalloregulator ArsR/SmtB family transcription factor [Pyrinomonadaceae bacterium]|nr:metalloregulator ArsR/SmtB family transcription factor [Pyrinomonadaceae bacterium]